MGVFKSKFNNVKNDNEDLKECNICFEEKTNVKKYCVDCNFLICKECFVLLFTKYSEPVCPTCSKFEYKWLDEYGNKPILPSTNETNKNSIKSFFETTKFQFLNEEDKNFEVLNNYESIFYYILCETDDNNIKNEIQRIIMLIDRYKE